MPVSKKSTLKTHLRRGKAKKLQKHGLKPNGTLKLKHTKGLAKAITRFQLNKTKFNKAKAEFKKFETQVTKLRADIENLKVGIMETIEHLKMGIMETERRRAVNQERYVYRHDLLFKGIKEIFTVVQYLKKHSSNGQHDGGNDNNNTDPGQDEAAKRALWHLERELSLQVDKMNVARIIDDVQFAGDLAVYAADALFKHL